MQVSSFFKVLNLVSFFLNFFHNWHTIFFFLNILLVLFLLSFLIFFFFFRHFQFCEFSSFYISRSLYQIQKSVLFWSSSSGSDGVARVIWWWLVVVDVLPADIVGSVFRRFILPFNFFNIVACRPVPPRLFF